VFWDEGGSGIAVGDKREARSRFWKEWESAIVVGDELGGAIAVLG